MLAALSIALLLAAPTVPPGEPAWQRLQALVGTWESTPAKITLTFRLASRGSVLVESYQSGTTETLTLFHRDGARLLAIHYCAQGNQPRLQLLDPAAQVLVFDFKDVTNLERPGASHLVRLTLDLRDANTLVMSETYLTDGRSAVTTTFKRRSSP